MMPLEGRGFESHPLRQNRACAPTTLALAGSLYFYRTHDLFSLTAQYHIPVTNRVGVFL